MCWLREFICKFICESIHVLVCEFIRKFIHEFICLLVREFISKFIWESICVLVREFYINLHVNLCMCGYMNLYAYWAN